VELEQAASIVPLSTGMHVLLNDLHGLDKHGLGRLKVCKSLEFFFWFEK